MSQEENKNQKKLFSQSVIEEDEYSHQHQERGSMTKTEIQSIQDYKPLPPSEQLQLKGITFVKEIEFKKDNKCRVCKQIFGKIKDRQHHCRLCAESVCDECSTKRINDIRVCDLCFYKYKSLKSEKRKKKLLQSIREYMNQLSENIQRGQRDVQNLKNEIETLKEKTKTDKIQRQETLEKLKQEMQKNEINKKNEIESMNKCLEQIALKTYDQQKLNDELSLIENQLQVVDNSNQMQKNQYTNKLKLYNQLEQSKLEIEQTEGFQLLPNYQKVKKYNESKLSEAIIAYDKQQLKEKGSQDIILNSNNLNSNQNNKIFNSNTRATFDYGQNQQEEINQRAFSVNPQYYTSYSEMLENNSLIRDSVSSMRRHEVRPKGEKFMCYI